jgi:hypothetical protein
LDTDAAQPADTRENNGRVYTILGFVFAAVAVLFLPIVFGPAGIILGLVGRSKGDRHGGIAAILATVGMILGFILGAAVMTALRGS